jgi:hypothetical protein
LFIEPRLNFVFKSIAAFVALLATPAALLAMVFPSFATSSTPESLFSAATESK